MDLIRSADAQLLAMPQEQVDVPALGGAVIVRGLLLSERLAYASWRLNIGVPKDGETQDDVHLRVGALAVPKLLSICVRDAEGRPVFIQEQWEQFGAVHAAQCLHLFSRAWGLSGFDEAAVAKN